MILVLVLFLLLAGCMGEPEPQKVFQLTCWNGGTIIYDKVVVRAPAFKDNRWETLDGEGTDIPYGEVACTHTLLRKQELKEAP